MEVSILIRATPGNGFRAWCGEPVPAAAEGATRAEALANLRAPLEAQTRGVEVVRLTLTPAGPAAADPPTVHAVLSRRYASGVADTAARHDEHHP